MKKIMIMLGAVAMGVAAQASIVNWSSTAVKFGGTAQGNLNVQLWIVGIGSASDMQIDLRQTAPGPFGTGALGSDVGQYQKDLGIAYNSTVAGGAVAHKSGNDWVDDARQYYMVLTYNDGTADYKYVSSVATSSGLSDSKLGSVSFTFNDRIIESGTDGWVKAVPEPTSGLLLLLGVAGLALKRRRA